MREKRTSTYLEKSLLWDVSEIMMDDTWNEERERKFHPVCQSLSNIVLKIIQRSTRDDVANNRTRKKERKKKGRKEKYIQESNNRTRKRVAGYEYIGSITIISKHIVNNISVVCSRTSNITPISLPV